MTCIENLVTLVFSSTGPAKWGIKVLKTSWLWRTWTEKSSSPHTSRTPTTSAGSDKNTSPQSLFTQGGAFISPSMGEKSERLKKKCFNLLFLGRCWSQWRLCSSWCWSGILSREEAKSTATTRSLCASKCWSRSWVWGWVYWQTSFFFRFYLKSQPFVRAFEPVLFVSARIYIFLFKLMGFIFINNKNHLYLNNALRAFLQIWNKSLLEHKDELMRFECSKVTVTSQNIFSHYSTIYISVTSVLTQMSVGSEDILYLKAQSRHR